MLNLKQGEELVRLARMTLENYFNKGKLIIEKTDDKILNEKRGVFVTLENYSDKSLRGCIGYPYAILPLWEAVQRAVYSSAFQDPRFSQLKKEELDKIIIEVSMLTEPKLIEVENLKEYFKQIELGRDGLIIKNGPFGGLLLPQVPIEFNWSVEEFLDNLCYKAGMTPDYIHDKNTKIWKFQAQIFAEKKPNGEIVELTKHSR